MAGDSGDEKTGTPLRAQFLRKRWSMKQQMPENIAAITGNVSTELTTDFYNKLLDTLERLDDVLMGLQKLPEFCGEDIEGLSSQINQLIGTLENRAQSFHELDEANDLIYDAEELIKEIICDSQEIQRFGSKERSTEDPCTGLNIYRSKEKEMTSKPKMKSKIELVSAKIQNFSRLLLGSEVVFPICRRRFTCHQEDPVVADKISISLENVWKHEVDFMVGIEDTKGELISHVLGGGEEFKIIGLLGMGGIGKTTLAKAVYQDISVRRYFDCFAWVRVGEPFRSRRVLEDILISVTCHEWEEMMPYSDSDLAEILYNFLEKKRYLIVLDDVWDKDAWDCLNISFPTSEEMGSRLLLTTRCDGVATKIAASAEGFVHEVRRLTEQKSLKLLFRTAFRAQLPDPKTKPELIEVAKQIVQACSGLPLMVKLVGGILTSKPTPLEWKVVRQNIVLCQKEGKGVTCILNLAYDSLPYYLKPCFLYTAMFRKGAEVDAKSLYFLWFAEGLILPPTGSSGKMSTMEIAEWYMCELHIRSMVSVHNQEVVNARRFKSYHLHDLLHDLCILKQKESNFCINIHPGHAYDENLSSCSSPKSPLRISRLALYFEDESFVPLKRKKIKNLESVTINSAFHSHLQFPKLSDLGDVSRIKGLYLRASNCGWRLASLNSLHFLTSEDLAVFERLRVLDCDGFDFDQMRLSHMMEKLCPLRCLNLRNCNVESLPSSISSLSNLETLYLPEYTSKRVVMPIELQYLSALRFLYLPRCFEVQGDGKLQIDRLKNLEELVNFDSDICEVKGLSNLAKLRTLVAILNGKTEDITEVKRSVVTNCPPFLSLVIRMPDYYIKESHSVIEDLWRWPNLGVLRLEGIMGYLPTWISHSLHKLSLSGSKLDEDPMGKLEKLPNLCVLELHNNAVVTKCMTCSDLGMPQLRHLTFSELENLENLAIEKGSMPNLSILVLERCERLKDVSEGVSFLTSLEEVKVLYMPQAFVDSLTKAGECLPRDKHAYVVRTNQLF